MAGREAQALISDNVFLDFSGLFSAEPTDIALAKNPVEPLLIGEQYKTLQEQEKTVKTDFNGSQPQEIPERDKGADLDAERTREAYQQSLEAYRTYQENNERSGQIQTEILKGIKAGEDVYSLFLKAAKAISLMTSNTVFYTQIEEDIRSIYGRGLNNKPPLRRELQAAQKRLQRLIEAEQSETRPDSQERIKRAVEAHRTHIAELEAMIARE